jgi:hypothetical protein
LAFDRAAVLYETAILLETEDKAKIELLHALGDCRASDGHAVLAADAYEQAAVLSGSTVSLRLRHLAAEQLLRGGHISRGLDVLKDVLTQAGLKLAKGPRRAMLSFVSRLLWLRVRGLKFKEQSEANISTTDQERLDVYWSVNIGLGVVDILRADDFLIRFVLLALKTGDIRRIAQGLGILSGQLAALGSAYFSWAGRLTAEAEVLARRSSDHPTIGLTRMSKGILRYFLGDWDAAVTELFAVEQYFLSHCHGVSWELATTRSFACFSLRLGGRLRELCQRFDRYTADADRTGDRYLAANLRTYQSIVWMIRDEVDRAAKEIEGILDVWPSDMYGVQHFFHFYARCEQRLYAGQPEEAFQIVLAETPRLEASGLLKSGAMRLEFGWISGRVSLAAAECVSENQRSPFLHLAKRSVRILKGAEHQTWVGICAAVEAGMHWLTPGMDRTVGRLGLERAVATAESAGAILVAESGRRWLGEITGGRRGEDLRARSNGWMADQGVKNPVRLAHLVVPGFRSREG